MALCQLPRISGSFAESALPSLCSCSCHPWVSGPQTFYLGACRTYSVGRKDCDIVINTDRAVSRHHADLILERDAAAEGASADLVQSKLLVRDRSKLGTFINRTPSIRPVLSLPNATAEVHHGDTISFGTNQTSFRVLLWPLCLCAPQRLFSSQQLNHLQSRAETFGAALLTSWQDECSHCVVPETGAAVWDTPDILEAAACAKPLVSPQWVEQMASRPSLAAPLPTPESCRPTLQLSIFQHGDSPAKRAARSEADEAEGDAASGRGRSRSRGKGRGGKGRGTSRKRTSDAAAGDAERDDFKERAAREDVAVVLAERPALVLAGLLLLLDAPEKYPRGLQELFESRGASVLFWNSQGGADKGCKATRSDAEQENDIPGVLAAHSGPVLWVLPPPSHGSVGVLPGSKDGNDVADDDGSARGARAKQRRKTGSGGKPPDLQPQSHNMDPPSALALVVSSRKANMGKGAGETGRHALASVDPGVLVRCALTGVKDPALEALEQLGAGETKAQQAATSQASSETVGGSEEIRGTAEMHAEAVESRLVVPDGAPSAFEGQAPRESSLGRGEGRSGGGAAGQEAAEHRDNKAFETVAASQAEADGRTRETGGTMAVNPRGSSAAAGKGNTSFPESQGAVNSARKRGALQAPADSQPERLSQRDVRSFFQRMSRSSQAPLPAPDSSPGLSANRGFPPSPSSVFVEPSSTARATANPEFTPAPGALASVPAGESLQRAPLASAGGPPVAVRSPSSVVAEASNIVGPSAAVCDTPVAAAALEELFAMSSASPMRSAGAGKLTGATQAGVSASSHRSGEVESANARSNGDGTEQDQVRQGDMRPAPNAAGHALGSGEPAGAAEQLKARRGLAHSHEKAEGRRGGVDVGETTAKDVFRMPPARKGKRERDAAKLDDVNTGLGEKDDIYNAEAAAADVAAEPEGPLTGAQILMKQQQVLKAENEEETKREQEGCCDVVYVKGLIVRSLTGPSQGGQSAGESSGPSKDPTVSGQGPGEGSGALSCAGPNFKRFRKRQPLLPSGNSFASLVPFSQAPYREAPELLAPQQQQQQQLFAAQERQRREREMAAEELFQADRLKRKRAVGAEGRGTLPHLLKGRSRP